MERGNVLVIGNSGVGKSTLINSVLGENKAKTGWGGKGTTSKLELYESNEIPFRIIDTIGFEPAFIKEQKAISAVNKWSKACAKAGKEDNQINVIWFCVEGTSSKLFPKALKDFYKATKIWKSVPIIVVITKSYSIRDRNKTISLVKEVFEGQKKQKRIKDIIPVVAETYYIDDETFAPVDGITDLIDKTNDLMPEGKKAGNEDLKRFTLNRRRFFAQSIVAGSTMAGAFVSSFNLNASDASILNRTESFEVSAIAKVYGISDNEQSKAVIEQIVKTGTVSVAAKKAIEFIKKIPKISKTKLINPIVSGCIVATIGETAIHSFEQIYLGKKNITDLSWVSEFAESQFSDKLAKGVENTINKVNENADKKEIVKAIIEETAICLEE